MKPKTTMMMPRSLKPKGPIGVSAKPGVAANSAPANVASETAAAPTKADGAMEVDAKEAAGSEGKKSNADFRNLLLKR